MSSKGIVASEGVGIGSVVTIKHVDIKVERSTVSNVSVELDKLNDAINNVMADLTKIAEIVKVNIGEKEAQIIDAHKLICSDVEIIEMTKNMVTDEQVNVEFAYNEVTSNFITMFESLEDTYMKERAADIKDVSLRVLRKMLGIDEIDLSLIDEDSIIIAEDLTPSQTSQLNKFVKGFITMTGGKTSHSAIIARSLEIPAIVGLNADISLYNDGDSVILDALDNNIIVNPSNEEIANYQSKLAEFLKKKELWSLEIDKDAITPSGKKIDIAANIATLADVELALNVNAAGVGLLRTEFLYMEQSELPSEDYQYDFYKKVLDAFPNDKVVIRTLDIGGDKNLPYLKFDEEMNPFLGVRAIRLCFKYPEMFKTQIRALLRANTSGNLCIMFPMIALVEEFLKAKEYVMECYDELIKEGFEISEKFELGTMVEIPSVAIIADEFAEHVDFFSIGTNDLIQYTLASDRMNPDLGYLYQPMNNAITTLIKNVVKAGKKHGKWVGMCGEMAGDTDATKFLADIEIDELSMNTKSILKIKYTINNEL